MIYVQFTLVAEGPSDGNLVPHLEELCLRSGADEVIGVCPEFQRLSDRVGRSVHDRVTAALILEPGANLLMVHRDADSRDATQRHEEIAEGVTSAGATIRYVSVVPVQTTEAWLLLDVAAIRRVAGNPQGSAPLNLPGPGAVEQLADPKEKLKRALLMASGSSGRRRQKLSARFGHMRGQLLENLSVSSALHEVPSWRLLRDSIQDAVAAIAGSC